MIITTRIEIDGDEARCSTAIAMAMSKALISNIYADYEPMFDEYQGQVFVFTPDEADQYFKEKAEGLYENNEKQGE